MASLAAYIGFALKNNILSLELLLALVSVFSICAAGMLANDIADLSIDKNRPLARGTIPIKLASIAMLLFFAVGLLSSFLINLAAFSIAIFASLSLVIYSFKMRKYKVLGNFVVALNSSLPFIFGYFSASLHLGSIFVLTSFFFAAFFASLARELLKDLEQKEIDKGFKVTLPHMLKEKFCIYVVFIYLFLAVLALFAPLLLSFFSRAVAAKLSMQYLIFTFLASVAVLASFANAIRKNYSGAKFLAKIAMFLALISFLFFVI